MVGKVLTLSAHPPHTSREVEQWHPDMFYETMHKLNLLTLRTIVAICRSDQEMYEEHRPEDHLGSGRGHVEVTPILTRPHDVSMSAVWCPLLLLLSDAIEKLTGPGARVWFPLWASPREPQPPSSDRGSDNIRSCPPNY